MAWITFGLALAHADCDLDLAQLRTAIVAEDFNMLQLARHRGIAHMVYASFSPVYGPTPSNSFRRDRVRHPLSPYAGIKKADELMSETYAHLYRLPLT